MDRPLLFAGAILGAAGVLAGTFGAHGLEGRLDGELLQIYETAVRYHLTHALAVVLAASLCGGAGASRAIRAAGWLFVGGVLVFSGSLYVLALSGARWLGAVTPLGGAAFILGWAALALGAWRSR